MTIEQTITQLEETQAQIQKLRSLENQLKEEIVSNYQTELSSFLSGKDYGCGTFNAQTAEHKLKFVVGKKVTWEQDGLRDLYVKIRESGDNPDEYIKTEFDVSEAKFKSWPSTIQSSFEPYRTVEPSKPTITIERK